MGLTVSAARHTSSWRCAPPGTSLASALVVIPAVLGMAVGQIVRGEMGEAQFRRCFFIGLLLLGGWLLVA